MDTPKFYIDVGYGEVRCRLTQEGVAKYSATAGWTDISVEKAVETQRLKAQQIVQKCDEWLDAWRRQRPNSVYYVVCQCGARLDPHEPVTQCPKCGTEIVVDWGGKK